MARWSKMLVALAAGTGMLCACGADEGHTPRLRKRAPSPSTTAEPTEPAEDAGTPAPAGPAVDASAAAAVDVHLSDLAVQVVANGYGPLEKDMSNGELEPNDGKTITLGGVAYSKGLGVHAGSEVVVALGGGYETFLADVGVDDEVADRGSIVFQVFIDGAMMFDSGVMTGTTETKKVSVDVTGKQELKLVVTDAGDGIGSDHGDWAGARLVKGRSVAPR